jgi:hypothetical protein
MTRTRTQVPYLGLNPNATNEALAVANQAQADAAAAKVDVDALEAGLAPVAFSGDYDDLINTPGGGGNIWGGAAAYDDPTRTLTITPSGVVEYDDSTRTLTFGS